MLLSPLEKKNKSRTKAAFLVRPLLPPTRGKQKLSSCVLEEATAAKLELGDLSHELLLLPSDLFQQILHAQHSHHLVR